MTQMEKMTDEQLRDWREDSSAYREIVLVIDELLALRAVWKIAQPHLPELIYRRALRCLWLAQ